MCQQNPEQRAAWGCDEATSVMVFGPTCERCDGAQKLPDGRECDLCEGRGDKYVFRCPASQLSREGAALLRMWGPYQNGVLPDPGGLYDQSASFVRAMSVLGAEKAAIEDMERPTPKKAP